MFGVDRTSNRAWKRRRNYIILMRPLVRLNRDRVFEAVMSTRPGLDPQKVKRMVRDLFEMDPAD